MLSRRIYSCRFTLRVGIQRTSTEAWARLRQHAIFGARSEQSRL